MQGNTKRSLKKEYIPLLIAILVLIILVLVLVLVITYHDDKGLVLPDLPEKEALNVGIFDIDSGKYNATSFDASDTTRVKVKYEVIKDYYSKGILLSNPIVDYGNSEFMIYSSIYANDPYISTIDKDGKLKWLNKINKEKYDYVTLIKAIGLQDKYYVFVEATKNDVKDIVAIRINSKGNEEQREVLLSGTNNSLKQVINYSSGFALVLDGSDNIQILTVSKDFKLTNNIYNLNDDEANLFHSQTPVVLGITISNDVLTIPIRYAREDFYETYLLKYEIKNKKATINSFTDLNNINKEYYQEMINYNGNMYTFFDNKLYKFSADGKLLKSFDYNTVKTTPEFIEVLSEPKDDEEEVDTDNPKTEKIKNTVSINSVKTYNGYVAIKATTLDSYIYDIYDEDLNLKKRYVWDINEYENEPGILFLDSFYIDNKLFKVNFFGLETPSIMISIVG